METLERDNRLLNIKSRFGKALATYDDSASAQRQISRKLLSMLDSYGTSSFENVLEIGCGTGGFSKLLLESYDISRYTGNDLCESCEAIIGDMTKQCGEYKFCAGDAETLHFDGNYDLIASSSAFQWMTDQASFYRKLASLLSDNGALLFSTFAPGNLSEVRTLTGIGLNYDSIEKICSNLKNNFYIRSVINEEIVLWFDSPMDVLRHLKKTGVTSVGNNTWTRSTQKKFCDDYAKMFSNYEGNVRLTYKPIYVLAIKL